ncbi:leucyl aminopeptidase [Candidatus Woesearchaeota archaeon]|nr:leucyl aminopeptidase [Candidatus Woesearchaeota archaeon]
MKTLLFTKELEDLKTEALVVGFYESFGNSDIDKYDVISDGLVNEVIKSKEFTGKFGKVLMLRLKGKLKRLVLVGLGKREEFGLDKAREISGKAAVYVRDQGIGEFSIVLFEDINPYDAAYCVVEGVKLSLYQFNDFKTQGLDDIKKVDQFTLVANGNNFVEIDNAIRKALVITDAVYYVRDLQNKPSNVVTPSYLAEEAKRIAARFKFKCTVLETKDMKKLGMGGMLAVSRGSDHLPKFIIFEYNGGKETFCFVGKGITFDSGGISLKPSQDMDDMKFDMSGGAVIFGLMIAVSQLKLPYRVVGLVPATENLPGGNAYKPGDIIKFHNGKTAEIINTDAEGRLVLGDALAYSKRFNPNAVIDFATLTGACVVSLGNLYAGLFSNSDEFSSKLVKAGENSGELIWRMPLHDKYKEHVKSNVADIKNSGSRDAGAITAAVFLKEFVECKKWAHIDIAGTAYTKNNKDVLSPYGGTGFGVRLIMKLLEDWKTK